MFKQKHQQPSAELIIHVKVKCSNSAEVRKEKKEFYYWEVLILCVKWYSITWK